MNEKLKSNCAACPRCKDRCYTYEKYGETTYFRCNSCKLLVDSIARAVDPKKIVDYKQDFFLKK